MLSSSFSNVQLKSEQKLSSITKLHFMMESLGIAVHVFQNASIPGLGANNRVSLILIVLWMRFSRRERAYISTQELKLRGALGVSGIWPIVAGFVVAPPQRPWVSARKDWPEHSGSQVRGEWSGRLTNSLTYQCSNVDIVPICCGEDSWAWKQIWLFTGQSTSPGHFWVEKQWKCWHKRRLASFKGWSRFSIRDKVRSSVFQEGLGVQLLLLHVE